ncbi:hypothetical protein N8009_03165, partial [Flavobacteriaceae bacterium]|nr:hypothetical protein [Flavobacteriaceae bacterium]
LIMIPLVAVPALAISISPFVIEWFWLKPMIIDFENLEFISKAIVVLTIWIMILAVVYFLKTMILGVREEQKPTDNSQLARASFAHAQYAKKTKKEK